MSRPGPYGPVVCGLSLVVCMKVHTGFRVFVGGLPTHLWFCGLWSGPCGLHRVYGLFIEGLTVCRVLITVHRRFQEGLQTGMACKNSFEMRTRPVCKFQNAKTIWCFKRKDSCEDRDDDHPDPGDCRYFRNVTKMRGVKTDDSYKDGGFEASKTMTVTRMATPGGFIPVTLGTSEAWG